ncbi:ACT domain repeat 8 [Actinidia rufa]|uniref:ACT domain-containing protein ACR n=1 Tax=Actinidia rufa TaxID=165716 RepID=A0A7J0DG26_9ERIC|nr:ACT domain repeat 8 [Actinidia rufa]
MIDNAGCSNTTRITIDSARQPGILLEAVRVLTDMNVSIKKAYICSDGRWFMDVFHVTDQNGNKLTDDDDLNYIKLSLGTIHYGSSKGFRDLTALELTGTDRLGLLSEVFAVLSDLQCNVVESKVWTHNGRIASVIYVKDCDSGSPIEDPQQIDRIEGRLRNVLKGDNDIRSAKTSVSMGVTHTERRLHQMMFADRDYERKPIMRTSGDSPLVTVQNCLERGYSVMNIQCKDRMKLLFDVVCTLTDMQYVVFHATVNTAGDLAYMGVRLELVMADRRGLLADVMRTFRENGLNVTRAEISTIFREKGLNPTGDTAENVFYVTDASGNPADLNIIESVRQKVGMSSLIVKELPSIYHQATERDEPTFGSGGAVLLSLGSLVRRNLYNLGLIKSYS